MNLKEQLKVGKKKLGIWGLGYIGFSTMAYFARAGVMCLGTDVREDTIQNVNKGRATIPNLDYWLGFNTQVLAEHGIMQATTDWKQLISNDVAVHLIAVPTEMNGKPYHDILKDVIEKIASYKNIKREQPPLLIIESTLTPTVADSIVIPLFQKHGLEVGKDILFGVAPRRDWFTSPDKSLKVLPRVVGGTTPETTRMMRDALSIICDTVLEARDHKHAAMVKSIENAFRQLDITFANQLSLAYPDMDIKSILQLVATKWNVGLYQPSFGTGGYCIPLAPQYVLEGAKYPEKLTLIKESLKTDFSQPEVVVESIRRRGAKNVAVLGIAYSADLKVHVLSPALTITRLLREALVNVKVNDPYYHDEEITSITGCPSFQFPQDLHEFDTILIVAGHSKYTFVNSQQVIDKLQNARLVVDNSGIWKELPFPKHIRYFEAGGAHWLEGELPNLLAEVPPKTENGGGQ